ncbi:TetR/AcrR family transcriptional regulator [Corynebacterium sp. TAE3-ERU12]|uniref:TetR/AcrR family transcriptional regulator n=1 Tax=Corynebacterium sp. TAE3-ERU12 TaxID=2849491 RepID=UPI001C488F4F|nr:TetR/AcrR family transcriptional regulator [Corynebacterium sp. TAE3-ERU12]MBV7294785.1 TetR/AcrR family transcriptional regulator [Corynebacterium sp. TAE3-ERU12]
MTQAPQQDRSRETRRKLLECTVEMLSTRGVQATTVSQVAEAAGVSRGAAQHHYPSREALIRDAVEKISRERLALFKQAIDEISPGAQGRNSSYEIVRLVLCEYTNQLFHAAVHIWSAAAQDAALREVMLPAEEHYNREVHKMVVTALRADLRDQHTRRVLHTLFDVARGLGLASVLVDVSDQLERSTQTYADFLSGIAVLDGPA